MRCELAQELILELELSGTDPEVAEHLAGCDACRSFLALQQSLDRELAHAYRPPELSPAFRSGVQARVRTEKRKRRWEALASVMAPCAGLVTSGLCALAEPAMAMFLLSAGLALSALSYLGQVLFVWLTEELGEG